MTRRLDPRVSSHELVAYGWPAGVPVTRQAFDQIARRVFDQYKRNWPVDTGLSKRGLGYTVAGNALTGYVMILYDRFNYAVWVERRWYPFNQQKAALIRQAVQGLSSDLVLGGVLRRSPVAAFTQLYLRLFLDRLTGDAEAA